MACSLCAQTFGDRFGPALHRGPLLVIHGISNRHTWATIIGGAAAALFVIVLSAVLMPAQTVVSLVIPGVLISALLGLIAMKLKQRADAEDEWKESVESFRDQLGIFTAFLHTSADMFMVEHKKQDLPIKWNELASLLNWPQGMRQQPLGQWRANAGLPNEAEKAAHRIAYGSFNAWQGHVDYGNARRNMTRIVGDWVAWAHGPYAAAFKGFIRPSIEEWRSCLIMLAWVEMALAEANPLQKLPPGEWADLDKLWPDILNGRPTLAPVAVNA